MDIQEICSRTDHTLLAPAAVWPDIQTLCDEAAAWHTASVCISPAFVRRAAEYLRGRIKVCTVIGFPNGCTTAASKQFEARDALQNGADELDMVINIGDLKEGNTDAVREEIRALKEICGSRVLKVIIETCLLTEQEKITMCRLVTEAGADYIKTSTGFSRGGATFADVELFARHIGPGVRIKAAGGISSLEDAARFIELGADRLGTSRVIRLVRELERK